MSVAAQCPVCGAPIEFRIGTALVVVCESCNSVVARGDRTLEQVGKVSDLVATSSPLKLWLEGSFGGVRFQVVGRAQIQHSAGGIWDEWYLAFDTGHWGWLAEAQGKFYLTYQVEGIGPSFESLVPGHKTSGLGSEVEYTVAERGEAQLISGEGEIPYRLETGHWYAFADLHGPDRAFATVDYSGEQPVIYVGKEVTLTDLGMHTIELEQRARQEVAGEAVSCPNCGGSLELAAPDKSQRVVCPYCDTALDVNQGNLTKLHTLQQPKVQPLLALGSKGTIDGVQYRCIGFMQRSVKAYGQKYYWMEYLLYEPRTGYRWLTESDGHWNFVEPVSISSVQSSKATSHGTLARHDNRTYRIFQHGHPRVEYVAGEFYWKVERGESNHAVDYIKPPYILSKEGTGSEINWSRGIYMTSKQVGTAFNCALPGAKSGTVGANQPYRAKDIYPIWAIVFSAAIILTFIVHSRQANDTAHTETMSLQAQRNKDAPEVIFSKPFKLKGNQNILVSAYKALSNSWLYLELDLINTQNGKVSPLKMAVEYYSGYTGGEYWTEGSTRKTLYLSSMPAGTYMLRAAVWRKDYMRPSSMTLTVRQGEFRARYWLMLLLGLSLVPIGVILHHRSFEKRRWSESSFSTDD